MESFGNLLEGMASLAWPFLALFVLVRFGNAVHSIIESAKGRKFTIKVGDYGLTMEEATEQQRMIINDLQYQVVSLQSAHESAKVSDKKITLSSDPKGAEEKRKFSILWVDDNPTKNSYEMAHLKDLGVEVTTAVSTEEALSLFRSGKYDCVISDMVRTEKGQHHYKAGIELVRTIRSLGKTTPIIIYSGAGETGALRQEALSAGANEMTASPTTLLRSLDQSVQWTS